MDYAIRIHAAYSELVGFFDKLDTKHIKYIVYQHDKDKGASRTHIHALLLSVSQSTDTLKNWVKEALNVTDFKGGNGFWSFKVAYSAPDDEFKYEHFVRYKSKGCLSPMRNSAFSAEQVDSARSRWVCASVASASETSPETVIVSVQKKTKNQIMEEVAIKLRNRNGTAMANESEIIRCVCAVLRENKVITNMYKIGDYVDSYKMWYHEEEFVSLVEKYYLQSRHR